MADTFEAAKVEGGPWYVPGDSLQSPKVEGGPWYHPPDSFQSPKVEFAAWISVPPRQGHVYSQQLRRRQLITVSGALIPAGDMQDGSDVFLDSDGNTLIWQDTH